MFGELPKLLDRNFAIGYFLPSALFAVGVWAVLKPFGLAEFPSGFAALDGIAKATVSIFVVWLGAIALLALNYPFLRLLEGYGSTHPLAWRRKAKKRQFRNDISPHLAMQSQREVIADGETKPDPPQSYGEDLKRAVDEYPDEEHLVLPTRFGNVFRAIEVYSWVIYGIDAIALWPRLVAVLPDTFRQQLASAKAQLDFCVNLIFIGMFTFLLYLVLAGANLRWPNSWIAAATIVVIGIGYWLSFATLRIYGHSVKSAFDLYRAELAKQMGFDFPSSLTREREMWEAVSRMIVFRSAGSANELVRFRAANTFNARASQNELAKDQRASSS
jgi:hypothetical protein